MAIEKTNQFELDVKRALYKIFVATSRTCSQSVMNLLTVIRTGTHAPSSALELSTSTEQSLHRGAMIAQPRRSSQQ